MKFVGDAIANYSTVWINTDNSASVALVQTGTPESAQEIAAALNEWASRPKGDGYFYTSDELTLIIEKRSR